LFGFQARLRSNIGFLAFHAPIFEFVKRYSGARYRTDHVITVAENPEGAG
jgi:hypothetical protein